MKKGFTLIELLAVIVILAVIALIATPIVLSIINDTKEQAVVRSAEFYVNAVENKIMQENMKLGGKLNPKECIVGTDGNVTCDGTALEIEVNGDKPDSGSITFDRGRVTSITLTFGERKVVTNANGELVLEDDAQVCTLINGEANTIGSKYECEVKSGTKYNFYVLSHNENGTTNLIMDRNICEDGTAVSEDKICGTEWDIDIYDSQYGPVNVLNYIQKATNDWNNIPNITIDYVANEGYFFEMKYGGIVSEGNTVYVLDDDRVTVTSTYTNLKARLPVNDEINEYNGQNAFLYDNMHVYCYIYGDDDVYEASCDGSYDEMLGLDDPNITHMIGVDGYWLLSVPDEDAASAVHSHFEGGLEISERNVSMGVRPVINLKL